MFKNIFKKRTSALRRQLIIGYATLAIFGYLLGIGAADNPDTDDVTERIKKTIEKIKGDNDTEEDKDDAKDADPKAAVPSPEPDDTDIYPGRILPEPDAGGGASKTVIIVKVEDIIDMGMSAFVARAINDNPDAAALILDINTPGGRVDAATEIRDAIMEAPSSMRTVAFIHPRAISAGAFISLACDLIFIADGGSIGAATPITIDSSGGAEAVGEKMVSYFRAEMATTARAKGRRGDIAEAMVDREIEIEGIIQAGKLLTLDTNGALKYKIADAKANNIEEVLTLLALGAAQQKTIELNWAEELARIFTHPILSGILMTIGVLGILIELYHPGLGLPGILGVTCLIIFFAGHMVVNLAGWEEMMLFVLGIGLLVAEIFVTPGFGLLGLAGIISIVLSLVLAITAFPIDVSFSTGELSSAVLRVLLSIVGAGALFALALVILPKTSARRVFVLDAAIKGTSSGGREGEMIQEVIKSGISGVAESYLRPAGIARFGDRRIDVLTEGDFIEQGTEIEIVKVDGNRVTVKTKES